MAVLLSSDREVAIDVISDLVVVDISVKHCVTLVEGIAVVAAVLSKIKVLIPLLVALVVLREPL